MEVMKLESSMAVSNHNRTERFIKSSLRRSLPLVLATLMFLNSALVQAENSAIGSDTGDDSFLDELEKAHFNYFVKNSDAATGLTLDSSRDQDFSSIAAVGFSLTSYIIAAQRGFCPRAEATKYVLKTLKLLWSLPQGDSVTGVAGYKGFFYHFLNPTTGLRYRDCELSSIDTALLMAGVLTCQSYFDRDNQDEREIRSLAKKLFDRVDWAWMYRASGFVSMGWNPEAGKGFLDSDWSMFCEAPLLIIMAAGSSSHPVPAEAWSNYCQGFKTTHNFGKERLNYAPTYGFQYPACWIDFKGIEDAETKKLGFDYFENARRILLGQYAYALANPMGWRDYGTNCWGLTACDGPGQKTTEYNDKKVEFRGYSARGCPDDFDDGTIAPTAIAASLPYAPSLVLPTLHEWRSKRPEIWGECGFKDSFNPSFDLSQKSGWVDGAELGIDQGPIVIMTENYRSGLIWQLMKQNDVIVAGLKRSGFKGGWLGERR